MNRTINVLGSVCFIVFSLNAVSAGWGAENVSLPAYGLFETSFAVSLPYDNPFDSASIRVDAAIQRDGGETVGVPCFFDGETWKLRYTPAHPGSYTFHITARQDGETKEIKSGEFQVTERADRGFVRIGKNTQRHFVFENGEPYFPLGQNLGWVGGREPLLDIWKGYLDECAQAGMNWVRVWMCSWGMTELTWTPNGGRYLGYERYDSVNAQLIDGIFQEAERLGIYIQWAINHHGQYSKETNPIWDENPFNVKNGGFLNEPWEFFTNEKAKHHYKNRLRYLVGRWGYSTHLLGWEFFNEVDLTSKFDVPAVKQWHEEMARYLREIDPYDHLRTTSASSQHEKLYAIEGLDYLQTHMYITRLIDALAETSPKRVRDYPTTPHFFGEMAYDWRGPASVDPAGVSLHEQLWASVHATADAGTAMTWWWDNWVRPRNLYPHFRALANYVEGIDWDRENLRPMTASIEPKSENTGPFQFVPPINWGTTRRTRFEIKETGEVEGLDECTQFVHGNAHRDMAPNPIFLLELDRPTQFRFKIAVVARAGATCIVNLDGNEVFQRVFVSTQNDSTMGEEGNVSIAVPSGRHNISIKNTGQDWFQVQYYSVDNLVQRPRAFARGNQERVLLWVYDRLHQLVYLSDSENPGAQSSGALAATTLTLPNLAEGEYVVEPFDPYAGTAGIPTTVKASISGLAIPIPSFEKDMAFRIHRKTTAVDAPLR